MAKKSQHPISAELSFENEIVDPKAEEQRHPASRTEYIAEDLLTLPEIKDVAELIKQARDRYHMSQAEFSCATGINPVAVSRLESRKTLKPSKKVLHALAPYMGISYTKLLMYAGYSGIYNEEIYLSKRGKVISHEKIVADIYRADPDFLEVLEDVCTLPLEDIKIVCQLIAMMKWDNENRNESHSMNSVAKIFSSLKKFLSEQLSELVKLTKILKWNPQRA